jgi:pyruvate dehydrogenase E1 component alpha subunit
MQLSRDDLLSAYRTMRVIRTFEEKVAEEFAANNVPGFVHLSIGQEASAAGVLAHLGDGDYVATTHRGHGHCIAFGSDPRAMMLEIFGRDGGLCKGKGGSIHIADIKRGMLGANGIVGGGAPLCVGAALAVKSRGEKGVALVFIGDGASNQGHVFEAMNLAAVWQVPVVFVYENNHYAESTSADYAVACRDLVKRAEAFGMTGTMIDGHDYFAVHTAAGEVIAQVRESGRPALIEIKLDRFRGHFEGDAQTYRGAGEIERLWAEADCLKIFAEKVTGAGLLEESQLQAIDAEATALLDDCAAAAHGAPEPAPEALLADVYTSY